MPVRNFEAPDGTAWTAWEVIPAQVSEFRSTNGPHLPRQMVEGWLCFDCGSEKRRLYPLPPNWAGRTDAELWFLCRAAEPVRPRTPADCDVPAPDGEPAIGARSARREAAGV
ncbi:MAG: hypothetical protein KY467_15810 [Gemmatimonadetes bacterium]|nr:hypothetical protein [Gemmatimonadota bacterium]